VEELIALSIELHVVFIVLLVVIIGINLYLLKSNRTFFKVSKLLELITPQYYIVLAAIFFTGLIVLSVTKFVFSMEVVSMLAVWLYGVVFGIKNHKVYKRMLKTDAQAQENYKKLAFKKYSVELGFLLVVIALAYGK
jgi:hypothetical protein